jgi:hypothetical protein
MVFFLFMNFLDNEGIACQHDVVGFATMCKTAITSLYERYHP